MSVTAVMTSSQSLVAAEEEHAGCRLPVEDFL